MNDQIRIDIIEENDTLVCKVVVPKISRDYSHKTRLRTEQIHKYLHESGHNLEGYELVKEGYIHNRCNPPILQSEWIYKKSKKQPTRKRKTAKKTK